MVDLKPIKIDIDLENLDLEEIRRGAETFRKAIELARYIGYHSRKQGNMR